MATETPIIGEYSPKMLWDMQKSTRDQLNEHCRSHKIDIDKIHEDTTEIKQSIAELNRTVSLLVECKKPIRSRYAWVSGAVIAALFGISQFWEYIIKK
jgi:hypothetical protein